MRTARNRVLTVEVKSQLWIHLEGKATGFADGSDMGDQRKKKIKDDSKVFGLSNQKHGIAIY